MNFAVSKVAPAAADIDMALDLTSFRRAVSAAVRVCRRSSIPILGYVRITAGDGAIAVESSDIDRHLLMTCEGAGHGSFAVPGRTLATLVHGADGDTIRVDRDGRYARFTAGAFTFRLATLPVGDFLSEPGPRGSGIETTFPEGTLDWLMKPVRHCISTEETRYYLNGVYVNSADGGLRATATDGHRLASRLLRLEAAPEGIGAIIPTAALGTLLDLAGQGEVQAIFWPDAKRATFRGDGWAMHAKMIDGTFPDVARLIPIPPYTATASIPRKSVARFLAAAAGLGEKGGVGVKLEAADGGVRLSVDVAGEAGAALTVSAELTGGLFFAGMQRNYLAAFLPHVGKYLTLFQKNSSSPVVIAGTDPDDRFVLMPMRL